MNESRWSFSRDFPRNLNDFELVLIVQCTFIKRFKMKWKDRHSHFAFLDFHYQVHGGKAERFQCQTNRTSIKCTTASHEKAFKCVRKNENNAFRVQSKHELLTLCLKSL